MKAYAIRTPMGFAGSSGIMGEINQALLYSRKRDAIAAKQKFDKIIQVDITKVRVVE